MREPRRDPDRVMGAFGQVTVNDAMVGKYTSEEWRSRA